MPWHRVCLFCFLARWLYNGMRLRWICSTAKWRRLIYQVKPALHALKHAFLLDASNNALESSFALSIYIVLFKKMIKTAHEYSIRFDSLLGNDTFINYNMQRRKDFPKKCQKTPSMTVPTNFPSTSKIRRPAKLHSINLAFIIF